MLRLLDDERLNNDVARVQDVGLDDEWEGQVRFCLSVYYRTRCAASRQLMAKLQAADGAPLVHVGGQWLVPRDRLIKDTAGQL